MHRYKVGEEKIRVAREKTTSDTVSGFSFYLQEGDEIAY